MGGPTIESGRYVFPVMYRGEPGEVAALDFRFSYDPAVFEPAGAETGAAALAAGKQVTANTIEPGQVVVLMMGANRNTVGEGPVAYVAMRQIAEPEDGVTRLTVSDTTFATAEGVEIPSQGSTRAVRMGEEEAPAAPAPDREGEPLSPDEGQDPPEDPAGGVDTGSGLAQAGGGLVAQDEAPATGSAGRASAQRTAEDPTVSTAGGDVGHASRESRAEAEAGRGGDMQPLGLRDDIVEDGETRQRAPVVTGDGGDIVPGTHTGLGIGRTAGDREIAATMPEPAEENAGLGRWLAVAATGVLVVLAVGWVRKRLFP